MQTNWCGGCECTFTNSRILFFKRRYFNLEGYIVKLNGDGDGGYAQGLGVSGVPGLVNLLYVEKVGNFVRRFFFILDYVLYVMIFVVMSREKIFISFCMYLTYTQRYNGLCEKKCKNTK